MGFYWILFTLIWITFLKGELTSAASLRSESLEFSPDAIDITKSKTEQNLPVERSNYNQRNNEYQRNKFRLPHERRNRQIYTSKTFFGRRQPIEVPKKYWTNKDKETAPLRLKTARNMYPVNPRLLTPHNYDNSPANPDHIIPHFNHKMPTIPENNAGYYANNPQGLIPDYDSNLGNVAKTEYGLNQQYNPNTGHEENPQYIANANYDARPHQNVNAGFGQVPRYDANAGYPEYYAQNRHGQGSAYNAYAGHGQDSAYNAYAGHGQNLGYNSNVGLRQDFNEANVRHEQVLGYGINAENGPNPGYDANVGNRPDPSYVNAGHGQDHRYISHAGQGQDHIPNANAGYRQNYGYSTNVEYGHDSGQNVHAGYASNVNENTNAGYESKIGYGANTYVSGLTKDESKKEIKSEKVDMKNVECKNEDDKKDVLEKKKTIAGNLGNKDSKEDKEKKYILNNDDHIKILNLYNQFLLSEKHQDSLLNKNTETTSTVANSIFISDANLKKEELLRHLPEDNSLKQTTSESVSNESEVTTSSFLEEFEGSGNIESFNEQLTSNQESNKSARILDIFSRVNDSNQCITPKNESGHCRGLTECPLGETMENFSSFLQYMCLQRSRLVGICCPDNPVIEISDPIDENSTEKVKVDIQQPPEGCGQSTNTRIVGGTMSIPHEFSWMVALLRRGRFYCGGVIINNWYILTAAHCVLGIKVSDLKVRLGEFDLQKSTEHQRDISVSEIKRHALFVTLTFQHDIAVLKLKRRIEYTKFIGSICLPSKDEGDFAARNATVVGWGTVSFGGAASPILRKVTVPVWDNKQCDQTYVFERINEAFMCAGSPENGEDACQGDSGGPLMTMNDDGRWSVIGIVSWGRRCGDPTFPGVYTRVTSYLDWIAENAQ